MRIECCIPKVTNTHLGYVIFIAFLLLLRYSERASIVRYMQIARLVLTYRNDIDSWNSTVSY